MAGLVHLGRMIDKGRAYKEKKLADYIYPCPLDKIILNFLRIDANTFANMTIEKKDEENSQAEDDEFNVSLAKMEEEIKPKILNILDSLNKNYLKLQKYQKEKLECVLNSQTFSLNKEKNCKVYYY